MLRPTVIPGSPASLLPQQESPIPLFKLTVTQVACKWINNIITEENVRRSIETNI